MKFTLGWLKEHLDTTADLDTIVETLTRIGLEVEGVENSGEKLAAFRVARVLTAAPHPQADKLQVLSVDTGDGVPLQVVCGAPNARAGMIGVLGLPGATVPSNGMVLKVSAIRGVESNGMMCSTRELELGDDHDGIIELPADAPVGTTYPDYAGLNDPVIDVSITPNRQDCMGVLGIARDLAAAGLGTFKKPKLDLVTPHGAAPHVRYDDQHGCPTFYLRRIAGVTNGVSPAWMQARLKAIGQKPISALVDITNYLMFDLGRPLHVYDDAKMYGDMWVRKAWPGEQILALNGKNYALDETMTVIADEHAAHDIGGIMGGEHSGVQHGTTDILLECAFFDPSHVARTGQKLNLTSDARQRFERGVDIDFVESGMEIATRMIVDICGGTASEVARKHALFDPADEAGEDYSFRFTYDPALAETLGGLAIPAERQREILDRLGFDPGADWVIVTPGWRRDVRGPADIVEEVIRIEGIDKVPSIPLPRVPGVARPTATPEQKLERRMRRTAAARGLNEAVTWSFIAEKEAAPFGGGAWSLANPISEELKVMRPSLLPGLLMAAARNVKRGAASVRLFEIGRRYLAEGERATLTLLLTGDRQVRGWANGKAAAFDAYDAKAEALALLAAAGAPVANLQVMGEAGDAFHPGQSGTLRLGPKTVLATFGMVHPGLTKAFDLDGPVAAVELFLDAIPPKRSAEKSGGFMRPAYAPPALQAVKRDFAFLVPAALPAGDLVRAVKGADKAAIVEARLFDRFTGAGVEEGHKSLAIEVTLQPGEKSFTDAELKTVADKVVAAAAKLGAVLRG